MHLERRLRVTAVARQHQLHVGKARISLEPGERLDEKRHILARIEIADVQHVPPGDTQAGQFGAIIRRRRGLNRCGEVAGAVNDADARRTAGDLVNIAARALGQRDDRRGGAEAFGDGLLERRRERRLGEVVLEERQIVDRDDCRDAANRRHDVRRAVEDVAAMPPHRRREHHAGEEPVGLVQGGFHERHRYRLNARGLRQHRRRPFASLPIDGLIEHAQPIPGEQLRVERLQQPDDVIADP